jgi:hypothetical protein
VKTDINYCQISIKEQKKGRRQLSAAGSVLNKSLAYRFAANNISSLAMRAASS